MFYRVFVFVLRNEERILGLRSSFSGAFVFVTPASCTRYSENTNDLVRLQNTASNCCSSEWYSAVTSTQLLLKDSQQKQMDDRSVLSAATVARSKLSKLCQLLSFHELIYIRKTKGHSGNFPFHNQQGKNMDCVQGLWTMDCHCSVRSHNKVLNNEAQNEEEQMTTWCLTPWIPRNPYWRDSLFPFIAF